MEAAPLILFKISLQHNIFGHATIAVLRQIKNKKQQSTCALTMTSCFVFWCTCPRTWWCDLEHSSQAWNVAMRPECSGLARQGQEHCNACKYTINLCVSFPGKDPGTWQCAQNVACPCGDAGWFIFFPCESAWDAAMCPGCGDVLWRDAPQWCSGCKWWVVAGRLFFIVFFLLHSKIIINLCSIPGKVPRTWQCIQPRCGDNVHYVCPSRDMATCWECGASGMVHRCEVHDMDAGLPQVDFLQQHAKITINLCIS